MSRSRDSFRLSTRPHRVPTTCLQTAALGPSLLSWWVISFHTRNVRETPYLAAMLRFPTSYIAMARRAGWCAIFAAQSR